MYLIPHYIREGKSYLTIAFGCTGGKHRSVLIAEEVKKRLAKAGYNVKVVHRDSPVGQWNLASGLRYRDKLRAYCAAEAPSLVM